MRRHKISFQHAWDGIWYNITTQPNFRFHMFAAFVVAVLGVFFRVSRNEWSILVFTIVLVIALEMLNTSVEAMTDLLTRKYAVEAKIAKDTAAGMVLVGAFGAVLVGIIIFYPYIL